MDKKNKDLVLRLSEIIGQARKAPDDRLMQFIASLCIAGTRIPTLKDLMVGLKKRNNVYHIFSNSYFDDEGVLWKFISWVEWWLEAPSDRWPCTESAQLLESAFHLYCQEWRKIGPWPEDVGEELDDEDMSVKELCGMIAEQDFDLEALSVAVWRTFAKLCRNADRAEQTEVYLLIEHPEWSDSYETDTDIDEIRNRSRSIREFFKSHPHLISETISSYESLKLPRAHIDSQPFACIDTWLLGDGSWRFGEALRHFLEAPALALGIKKTKLPNDPDGRPIIRHYVPSRLYRMLSFHIGDELHRYLLDRIQSCPTTAIRELWFQTEKYYEDDIQERILFKRSLTKGRIDNFFELAEKAAYEEWKHRLINEPKDKDAKTQGEEKKGEEVAQRSALTIIHELHARDKERTQSLWLKLRDVEMQNGLTIPLEEWGFPTDPWHDKNIEFVFNSLTHDVSADYDALEPNNTAEFGHSRHEKNWEDILAIVLQIDFSQNYYFETEDLSEGICHSETLSDGSVVNISCKDDSWKGLYGPRDIFTENLKLYIEHGSSVAHKIASPSERTWRQLLRQYSDKMRWDATDGKSSARVEAFTAMLHQAKMDLFTDLDMTEEGSGDQLAKRSDVERYSRGIKQSLSTTDKKVDEIRLTVNRLDARDKREKRNKRTTFNTEELSAIYQQWNMDKKNPEVKRLSQNGHKPGCEAAFEHSKDAYLTIKINSADELKHALTLRSKRLSYLKKKRLSQKRTKNPPVGVTAR